MKIIIFFLFLFLIGCSKIEPLNQSKEASTTDSGECEEAGGAWHNEKCVYPEIHRTAGNKKEEGGEMGLVINKVVNIIAANERRKSEMNQTRSGSVSGKIDCKATGGTWVNEECIKGE